MQTTLTTEQLSTLSQTKEIIAEIKKIIIGKDDIIVKVLIAIFAGGHILIDDIPGVGKTTLALALSKALSLDYKRLQFTPDVLPTDVTGFSVLNKETGLFEYKEGAAMCNLFLADEINRTSSKTQSSLLEIMEEGKTTVDGVTREMPKPYIVIATQNPIGSIGTQMLPESQLDRFIIRIKMGYPDISGEIEMLKSKQAKVSLDSVLPIMTEKDIIAIQQFVDNVFVSDKVFEYVAKLAVATREHPFVKLGLSPRGTISLARMAKATAFLKGRNYVIPDDVLYTINDVVMHRIILNSKAKVNNVGAEEIIKGVVAKVPVPRID